MNHDLNKVPWPIEDNCFEKVLCYAILEHVDDFYGVMQEIWRTSKDGAQVHIEVPHYSDTAAYTDPTHVNYFSSFSFDTLTGNNQWSYYTDARFEISELRIRLVKLYKYFLIEWLINASLKIKSLRFIRKIWENYFSFIIRAKSIEIDLKVVK